MIRKTNFQKSLLAWYDQNRRQLPWRETKDPYRIWISEVMLQQTRVQAVIDYYKRFLKTFPTMKTLATAKEEKLLAAWSGLGYYSRARNLQKAARVILREHNGKFPEDVAASLRLPGVGEYTARAVTSIAYDVPVAVLDGNVARVLSRLYTISDNFRKNSGKKILLNRADALLAHSRPGDFNQAMMELGATVCLPRRPSCKTCPVRRHCLAFSQDAVENYPEPREPREPKPKHYISALVFNKKGQLLLTQNPPDSPWMPGFWHPPTWEAGFNDERFLLTDHVGQIRHTITHHKIVIDVYNARLERKLVIRQSQWINPKQLKSIPVTTIARKSLALLESTSMVDARRPASL
ncbi:MAG: A/G-specific adenine glycosylase [Acidobacteria bacterium RIFCSPLOWO2_12_FULL_54_10]|nr:MAG: A/G-specific adenine glycosylase [Acidobacteria bacterium RIFCSPLOWO2_12_FULL_54_10]